MSVSRLAREACRGVFFEEKRRSLIETVFCKILTVCTSWSYVFKEPNLLAYKTGKRKVQNGYGLKVYSEVSSNSRVLCRRQQTYPNNNAEKGSNRRKEESTKGVFESRIQNSKTQYTQQHNNRGQAGRGGMTGIETECIDPMVARRGRKSAQKVL